jgi:hypothetical protein
LAGVGWVPLDPLLVMVMVLLLLVLLVLLMALMWVEVLRVGEVVVPILHSQLGRCWWWCLHLCWCRPRRGEKRAVHVRGNRRTCSNKRPGGVGPAG